MNYPKYLTFEELAAAHEKLREEYDRTREIVDALVAKFEGHVHGLRGITPCGPETEPPKKAE